MADSHVTENWRPVVGYEGLYEVSDLGRVRSVDRISFNGKGAHDRKGKLITLVFDRDGYAKARLCRGNKRRKFSVHRLVLEAFGGPCPDGMQACHFPDLTRSNNRLSNLRWDTPAANSADAIAHGTLARGVNQHLAKLDDDKVRLARRLRKQGLTYNAIAKKLGVTKQSTISAVKGKTWSHVKVDHVA